jgi:hypothetical protein
MCMGLYFTVNAYPLVNVTAFLGMLNFVPFFFMTFCMSFVLKRVSLVFITYTQEIITV